LTWLRGIDRLGWATKIAITEVLAAEMIDTGQLLQLVKIPFSTTILSIAALSLGAVVSAIFAAI